MSELTAFTAQYHKGSRQARPSFALRLEQGAEAQGCEHTVAVVDRRKYVLARPQPAKRGGGGSGGGASSVSAGVAAAFTRGGAGARPLEEQLSAVLFSELVPGVFTMELVMPVARSADGVVAPLLAPPGGEAGLLRQYQAGDTKGLLVFVGHVDLGRSSRRIKVSLSLPKTKSANLLLEQEGGALRVRYCEPIAPLQAFHAALALAHWLRSDDQRAPQRR